MTTYQWEQPKCLSRGREVVTRQAHNLKIGGAIPSPATKLPDSSLGWGTKILHVRFNPTIEFIIKSPSSRWPRIPAFHVGYAGSNPAGDAKHGEWVALATAPGCKPGTLRYTGFESGTEYHIVGDSPSWSRHWILIPAFQGSNPWSPTKLSQSGEVVSRQAHNLKIAGAIPASATSFVNEMRV